MNNRKAFEAWHKEKFPNSTFERWMSISEPYMDKEVQARFEGYQAGLASQAQQPEMSLTIRLNSIAEAARCLGVAQVKEDKDAITHWNKVVDGLVLSDTAQEQQTESKPAGFISAKTVEWLNSIGEMVDAKMELTFRTEPSLDPYTIPFYLQSQAQQEPVKPIGKNRYGLDAHYFYSAMSSILRNIESYTPDEMYRSLSRLADVVSPAPEGDKP